MKLIRNLTLPWIAFFLIATAGIVFAGLELPNLYPKIPVRDVTYALLALGTALCLISNFRSFGTLGIWMSESLPESLRYGSGRWFFRGVKAVIVAAAFWAISLIPWLPLAWNAIVLPLVLTITLFVFVWSFLGIILKASANFPFSRAFGFVMNLPVLAIVPAAIYFVSQTITTATIASHPELTIAAQLRAAEGSDNIKQETQIRGRVLSLLPSSERGALSIRVYGDTSTTDVSADKLVGDSSGKTQSRSAEFARNLASSDAPENQGHAEKRTPKRTIDIDLKSLPEHQLASLPKAPTKDEVTITIDSRAVHVTDIKSQPGRLDEKGVRSRLSSSKPEIRASGLREIAEFSSDCSSNIKEIMAALDPSANSATAYWAAKAVACANLKPAIAIPKLLSVISDHTDANARASAIEALKNLNRESVARVSYLLVKRLGSNEPSAVIDATSSLMSWLGGENGVIAMKRLVRLLETENNHQVATHQVAAEVLIRDFGREDRVVQYLNENLTSQDTLARDRAVDVICMLPPSHRSIEQSGIQAVVASIKTGKADDPGVKALGCIGGTALETVRNEIAKPQRLDRAIAARVLAGVDAKSSPRVLETVEVCARDQDEQVRKWCSQSLGQQGAQALPKIMEMLKSNDATVKAAGQNALRHFDDPTAKTELENIIRANSGWMANRKNLEIAKVVGAALVETQVSTH